MPGGGGGLNGQSNYSCFSNNNITYNLLFFVVVIFTKAYSLSWIPNTAIVYRITLSMYVLQQFARLRPWRALKRRESIKVHVCCYQSNHLHTHIHTYTHTHTQTNKKNTYIYTHIRACTHTTFVTDCAPNHFQFVAIYNYHVAKRDRMFRPLTGDDKVYVKSDNKVLRA